MESPNDYSPTNDSTLYKFKNQTGAKKQHRVNKLFGKYFIVLDDVVHPQENECFTMARLSDGKIVLDKNSSRPQVSQQADDQDYGA